ncbi:gliding motility-associated C-terminal domain-containing protein [Fluviicola chungangensis]|uniref:Gliding motility-associated C-terminal domain-containing protein n=1 Tax=Fluviicola chungangensis TaxID=2597671 RepID=A0A556N786_9FLAO|nr:gliding motility-associated C-terminal domain-containing protein [Fluviicola chungangensis]TSJ48015.1 gliding motility-associated C-terminal domain-containing protein [Fluviicola chungangensis]
MKLILIICSLCFSVTWTWSQTWGASTFSQTTNEAADIELNSLNESYVAGYFSGQTSFGPSTSLSSSQGNTDAYVAKYTTSGALLWVKQFGGLAADKAVDLAVGPDQNIVVTGQFFGSVTFGSTTLVSNSNSKDIFIVKLDPAGNVLWARKEGGSSPDNAYKVTIDNSNNILLTGEYQGTATIGATTFTSNNGSFDLFIAKYDSGGTPVWSLSGSADLDDRGLSVAVDASNNIFFTGQFSNTLTFASNTYVNNGINVGFLCKLNPAGQVQFLHLMKAGYVLPYDVEINLNNEAVVVGDFLGNMLYYDQNGSNSIQNPYDKQIFVLKTSNTGQYTWNQTLGSQNELSARALSIDPGNNIFVTGYFKCDLSQIQDSTESLFNSVGFKDPYLMKLSNGGSRTYIKQFGGKLDDEGKGVAVKLTDKPLLCGSYTSDLNFVPSTAVLGNDNFTFNPFLALEPYHVYLVGDQSRNSFLTNHVNGTYGNYNYFAGAASDSLVGFIHANEAAHYVTVIGDTVHFCSNADLFYQTLTYSHFGPSYTSTWYDGSQNPINTISSTGTYWVQHERDDECFMDMDSIYAIQEQTPTLPLLTDDHGINVNNPGPQYNNYHFCYPEGAIINFTNLDPGTTLTTIGNAVTFNGPGPHTLNQEYQYFVQVTNQYCMNIGSFTFQQDHADPPDSISLSIAMNTTCPTGDSIVICQNTPVEFHGIDLIINPSGNFYPSVYPPIDTVIWTIDGVSHINYDTAATVFNPSSSGWHTVTIQVIKGFDNICGLDTTVYFATRQFYVTVNPNPTWGTTISGGSLICPNESTFLVASNPNPNLSWTGSNILWSNNADSIEVNAPGWYNYTGTLLDSVTGCSSFMSFNHYLGVKIAPNITSPGDAVICPFDSLLMMVPNTFVSYMWFGPNGDTLSTTSQCYTAEIGSYVCNVTDAEGCVLTTPPFEVFEYSTPSLSVVPNALICNNETVDIQISYSGNAVFQWNTGSTSDHISTNVPGTYIVQITQCGITAADTIVIVNGSFTASISVSDSVLCFGDTAVFTGSYPSGSYEWMNGEVTGNSYSTTDSGTYSALVTNSAGCTAQTNSISVTTVPGSSPPSIASQTICPGDDITLTNASTIIWYSLDTTPVYTGTSITLTNVQQDTSFLISQTAPNSICGFSYSLVSVTVSVPPTLPAILGDSNLCINEDGVFHVNTTDNIEWFSNGVSLGSANPITIPFAILNANPVFSVEISNVCFSLTQTDSVAIITPEVLQLADDTLDICFFDSETAYLTNNNLSSVVWTGTFGTITDDELTVYGNLTYSPITVSAVDEFGCQTQTATLIVHTSTYNLNPQINFPNYCPGTSGNLTANTTSDSVLWITPFGNSDSNPLAFTLSQQNSGNFYLRTWDDMGCVYMDTLFIPLSPVPNLDILPDTVFCANDIYTFYFPNDDNTYYWTTYGNSTSIPITFDQQLILNVITPAGCEGSDTLVVHAVDCDDELPNIITPNGDGINDFFIIDDAYSQLGNAIIIINRWGNKMFEASPYLNNWDGSGASDGVYFYIYYPKGMKEPGYVKHGFIHVYGKD